MRYDWILDVLTDLRSFAAHNGLAALAAQLDEATRVAAAEIGGRGGGPEGAGQRAAGGDSA